MSISNNTKYFNNLGADKVRDCTFSPRILSTRVDEAVGKLSMSFKDRLAVTFYKFLSAFGIDTADKVQKIVWNYFNDALNANDYAGRQASGKIEPTRVTAPGTSSKPVESLSKVSNIREAYLPRANQAAESDKKTTEAEGSYSSFLEEDFSTREEIAFEKEQRNLLDKAMGKPTAPKSAPSIDVPSALPGLEGVALGLKGSSYADILPDLPGLDS